MKHYIIPPGFWMKFMLVMIVVIFLVVVIPAVVRHKVGADKKKVFSHNHINECHKKGDWTLRIIFIITFIVSALFFIDNPLILFIMTFIFLLIQQGFQVYAEWKFSSNRKNYKVSLIELTLFLLVFIGILLLF